MIKLYIRVLCNDCKTQLEVVDNSTSELIEYLVKPCTTCGLKFLAEKGALETEINELEKEIDQLKWREE